MLIQHLQELLYIKDSRVENLKGKLKAVALNLNRVANAKVYQQGNGLVFELDRAIREVRFY